LPDFKERWTEEMSYIPDVPVVMQISAFMSNSKRRIQGKPSSSPFIWQQTIEGRYPPNGRSLSTIRNSSSTTRKEWMDVPIMFPPVFTDDVSDGPLIVEAEVEGPNPYKVSGIFGRTIDTHWEERTKGRTGLLELRAISSTIHGMMKSPTPKGIATLCTQAKLIYECRWSERKVMEQEETVKETKETRNLSMEKEEKVLVNPAFPEQTII
nr:reverse transcriptase domain-containing protein [Tanacetum cinerariifolium]